MDPEAINISGISGRFANCANIDELKTNLLNGIDCLSKNDRWPTKFLNTPHRLGIINDLAYFDSGYFGMNVREADAKDPRSRKILEVVYEAIVDAGLNPADLRGSNTGVFLGVSPSFTGCDQLAATFVGRSSAIMANAISYAFDLKGMSYALDTGCSSSMYVLDHGVNAIKFGLCDRAIVAASTVQLDPAESREFYNLQVLSPHGRCATFSSDRDGYCKADGIVAFLLQKTKDCKRIYETIAATGTNVDGFKSEGPIHPSGPMQLEMLKYVYKKNNVNPDDVCYIEAHGTGTNVGDYEETKAIDEFFNTGTRKEPLMIGSVKTNVGHSEVSSGLVSLTKILLSVYTGTIPGNLHFLKPGADLTGIIEGRLKVVDKNTPYPGGLLAANSFGIGGANGHAIIKPYTCDRGLPPVSGPRLVQVSGRTEEGVRYQLEKVITYRSNPEFLSLLDSVYRKPIENHKYRGYAVLSENTQYEVDRCLSTKRPIWFVYSGMGSQWPGMGKDLMKLEVFRNTIKRCAEALKPHGVDLEDILVNGTAETFRSLSNSFPAITAVSVALTDVLTSLGIKPDGIFGHSVGEIGCAYADGLITPEQAVLMSYARAAGTLSTKMIHGLMAAVGLPLAECEKILPQDICLACDNSDDNVTISGPHDSVQEFCQKLSNEGTFNRLVNSSSIPFHSKYLETAGPKVLELLRQIMPEPKRRSKRWLPTAVQENNWHTNLGRFCSAEYFHHNFLNRVQFRQSFKHVPDDAVVIEIAPTGLFQAILKRALGKDVTKISLSSHKVSDNMEFFLTSIGKLYNAGEMPNLQGLYKPCEYPVSLQTPMISHLVKWDHSVKWTVPLFKPVTIYGQQTTVDINDDSQKFLDGHIIGGRRMYPASGYLMLVWKAMATLHQVTPEEIPIVMEDVTMERAINLSPTEPVTFIVNICKSTGKFEVCTDRMITVLVGKVRVPNDVSTEFNDFSHIEDANIYKLQMNGDDVYKLLHLRGYNYSGGFCGITNCELDGKNATIKWSNNWIMLIDILFHRFALFKPGLYLPSHLDRLVIDPIEHQKCVNESPDLHMKFNEELQSVKAGGVEIVNYVGIYGKRRDITEEPTLNKYLFVPELTQDCNEDPLNYSLRVASQLVVENTTIDLNLKVGDMVKDYEASEIIKQSLHRLDLKNSKFIKLESNPDAIEGPYDFLVTPDLTQESEETVLAYIKNSKFIFTRIRKENDSFFKLYDLEIIFKHITKFETYVLAKKSRSPPEEYAVITTRGSNFSWIEDLKAAIQKHQSPDSRIYLINEDHDSGNVGLFNCIRREKLVPNLRVFHISNGQNENFSIRSNFFMAQLRKDLTVNVYQDNTWGTFRLLEHHSLKKKIVNDACYMNIVSGKYAGLHWVQRSPYSSGLTPEISVHCAALNIWDVERIREGHVDDITLGSEYSGYDSGNNRVMGIVGTGALATTTHAHPILTWSIPYKWSFEDAATIPLAYTMVYYGLFVRNSLSSKDTILVHNGITDISMAAIILALDHNCQVFITVNNYEQKDAILDLVPKLNSKYILNNEESHPFSERVIKMAKGQKISVVFNSQNEATIKASLPCVQPGAKFVEIGTTTMDENVAKIILNTYLYSNFTIDDLLKEDDFSLNNIANNIENYLKSDVIVPLRCSLFEKNKIEAALTQLQKPENIGKVVVKIKDKGSLFSRPDNRISAVPRTYFNPEKCYIIVGGLGGFGLEMVTWMISRGAKKIILNGRRDVYSGYQAFCLQNWKKKGIAVLVDTSDTTTLEGAESLLNYGLNLGPIGAIFNSAMILRDELITNQQIENFDIAVRPKLHSAQNLDFLSRKLCDKLDYFIVFSSIVACLGNATQTPYGYANCAIERLCETRRSEGLHGLAVQWGPIGDVGFVARLKTKAKILEAMPQGIVSCLNTLDQFMQEDYGVLLSTTYTDDDDEVQDVKKNILDSIASIFGVKNIHVMDDTTTLLNLGMDSLIGFEVKNLLSKDYEIEMNMAEIRNTSLAELKKMANE